MKRPTLEDCFFIALIYCINILIKDLEMRKKIEKHGRLLIEEHFNIFNMKNNIKTIFEEN